MKPYIKYKRTDIWREGKWLDLWSVVHFLSGVSIAFAMSLLRFDLAPTIIIVLLILIAYELWEAMVKIEETPQNRFMDVVVGMFSFVPTFIYVIPNLSQPIFFPAFGIIFIINITLAAMGWKASQKAIVFEEKLHAEYMEQLRLLSERRARRKERRLRRRMLKREGRSTASIT